ncbi:MAG: bifunctional (p)ppGpp synthetase/guanosine-3',5'-bis(diphosphate) 3'-pyrophosphohydrolase [Clostridiales bacterium]|nr:bifunctional (p)ppGpp synthetase/guanosine-3',5'-bis(diphosphate) 3'-pyrophosphohydrolase [Clostridiales bacterium]
MNKTNWTQRELLEQCREHFHVGREDDLALFRAALDFCENVHARQKRDDGTPFVYHPISVAGYLLEMGADETTVIAGLLHDTVEDGEDITIEQVAQKFGKDIAHLVDGVTKLTKSGKQTYFTKQQAQSENLRKLFLSIAADARVVIIKMADRLHNMRTLVYCSSEKRVRKARETLDVYAPLAHRFGMGNIKSELEDLAFSHAYPEEYERIRALVETHQRERETFLQSAMEAIRKNLSENGVSCDVAGRPKHLFSVYRKMHRLNCDISDIYDLIAVRIVVEGVGDCYAALGQIHGIWKPMPGRFKDYIAMPKPNGYQSLHNTMLNEGGTPFEVQIRTRDMHRVAEFGVAAHWMYKEGRVKMNLLDEKTGWLRQVMEENAQDEDSAELVDNIIQDFLGEYVFVLSPRGEIFDLPVGSTPLDFAYRVHTNVGHHCHQARVNGHLVKLTYVLQTNDVVEIITNNAQVGPNRDWLNIVKTKGAQNKIRQWFKRANREENEERGRAILAETAKHLGQNLATLLTSEYEEEIFKRHNFGSAADMYAAIGYGGITAGQIVHKLIDMDRKDRRLRAIEEMALGQGTDADGPKANPQGIIVHGDPGMATRFAACCSPMRGDVIVGYISRGRGLSVHRADCKNVKALQLTEPARFIEVEWEQKSRASFAAGLLVRVTDKQGALLELSKFFVSQNINLADISCKATPHGYAECKVRFIVSGAEQLQLLMTNMRKLKIVVEVSRM